MRIVIPTYRRVDRQWTLRSIPKQWHSQTVLVVDKQDYRELSGKVPEGVQLLKHPPRVQTIAQKRAWIMENIEDDKLLMLDDDLRFSRRKFLDEYPLGSHPPFEFKLVKAKPKDINWALHMVDKQLDYYTHVGIGARQGNNTLNRVKTWYPNSRTMYALGYRRKEALKLCEWGRIETREDMDINLQLLTKGRENRVLVEVCVDQAYNGRGGASEERSVERSNRDAKKLAKWFPGIVKVVEKQYKQSIPRLEVVCQWKKAYESTNRF